MKIEPIYLVAPEPEKPLDRVLSRRTFFAATAACLVAGAAGGIVFERLRGRDAESPDAGSDGEVSERLGWALQLQAGPLEELVRHHESFLIVFANEPDARLLQGARRLAVAVLDDDPVTAQVRGGLAATLAAMFEASPFATELERLSAQLRRVR